MDNVIVSFATRPGHGGEGGVGWALVEAAIHHSASIGQRINVVIDARDLKDVALAVEHVSGSESATLHPVALPAWAIRRWGNARTRLSYVFWLRAARRRVLQICRAGSVGVIHQVTFATATLPAALPRSCSAKRIWGPIALPFGRVHSPDRRPRLGSGLWLRLARLAGQFNARRADLIIATNDITAVKLRAGHVVEVEPNIAVTMSDWEPAAASDPKLLTVAGLLIPRKRPWLAVDALAKPDLDSYRLQFVGDGPLRSELERRCELLGVSDRVHFAGQLEHARVLEAIAASRLLLHPSAREGAAWVIGEAAAVGVAAVAFADVGCASTVKLSNNGGELAPPSHDLAASLAEATTRALAREMPPPSTRWNRERFEDLIAQWWSLQ